MNKAERVLILFWQLYNGMKINKSAFCLKMEVDTRTFDRYIEGIRNFLAEIYAGQEIVFDRKDHTYFMTGAIRKMLTEVEYTAIATILRGSRALGKDETDGLIRSLGDVAECRDGSIRDSFFNRDSFVEAPGYKKPMLKIQWDLFQCIKRKVAIRLYYIEKGKEGKSIDVVPKTIYYENGELKLWAFHLKQEREEVYEVSEIESFEILRRLTYQECKQHFGL